MALNAEQMEALTFVADGHNIFITDQAGVGKACNTYFERLRIAECEGCCCVFKRNSVHCVWQGYGVNRTLVLRTWNCRNAGKYDLATFYRYCKPGKLNLKGRFHHMEWSQHVQLKNFRTCGFIATQPGRECKQHETICRKTNFSYNRDE